MTVSRASQLHPTLHHSTQQIRLLSVRECIIDGIECDISVFDLSDFPVFTALSYVWGPPDVQHVIYLNGQPFSIRHNLYLALRSILAHIKIGDDERQVLEGCSERMAFEINADGPCITKSPVKLCKYFWIDAICIDQTDVHERNHQVRLMSNIYKSAQCVLVWLGPECEEALASLAAAELSEVRAVFKPYTDRVQETDSSQSLIPFLSSPYWTRMWVVQEFVLADNLIFAAGSVLVSWTSVDALVPNIYAYRCAGSYAPALTLVNERRQHIFRQQQNIRPDLYELVQRFGSMECSDRRDRVFALHGLLKINPGGDRDMLLVDYRLTPAQLSVNMLKVAGKSIKHRALLQSLHTWLKAALEVDKHGIDTVADEEVDFVLSQATGDDEEEKEVEKERMKPQQPVGEWKRIWRAHARDMKHIRLSTAHLPPHPRHDSGPSIGR